MTPLFPARRSAERFDSMVEGGRRDDVDPATTDLLELVGALRSVPEPQARPEFVADLREQLMLAAATELTPVPVAARERDDVERLTIKPSRTRRERRIRVALGAVAIIGATTSMAVASQSAIPGDALYPVKRAIENTQAGFAFGDDAKGETVLDNASTRLDEVDKLSEKQHPDAKLVTQTLNTFSDQATEAGNSLMAAHEQSGEAGPIEALHQFTHQSLDTLGSLESVVPPEAHDALLNAAQVVFALDAAASNVCPDCGAPLTELPTQLAAGALTSLGNATDTQAGGQLPGATTPSDAAGATQPQHNGGKGHGGPSGMNPPETPITPVPTGPSDAASGLGGILPSGGGHQSGGGSTGGGKGGKHKPVIPAVTDTVNQVVTGVVEGVAGVLNGLTGN